MATIVIRESVKVGEQFLAYSLMDAGLVAGTHFHKLMRRLESVGQEAARKAVTTEYQRLCKATAADFAALGIVADEQPVTVPVKA